MKVDIYDLGILAAISAIAGYALHYHKWYIVLMCAVLNGMIIYAMSQEKKNES